jgi:hypothetical protein
MKDSKTTAHESFGMAGFSRSTTGGDGVTLFGSSIKHGNVIRFTVRNAEVDRHLEQDWYHVTNRLPIVEIEMSQSQFAEMITSMNMGDGIPVTLRYVNGKKMEDCPHESKVLQHSNEFKERMKEFSERVNEYGKELYSKIEKRLPKKDQDEVKGIVDQMVQEIASNIPFYEKQFVRQMEKTQTEAKAEIESFVHNKIHSAGLSTLLGENGTKDILKLE